MSQLVDIYKPLKSTFPIPTRKVLKSLVERFWKYTLDHVHDLEKGDTPDKYFAACLTVVVNNLKAIELLSSLYNNACSTILRNLTETCVDYFWVASYLEKNPAKGLQLTENFFLFGKYQFAKTANELALLCKDDVFLRDVETPFTNQSLIELCRNQTESKSFGDSWRKDSSLFSSNSEIIWKTRSEVAAEFVERHQNLKAAPYLSNLKALSSYSHFDPAQIVIMDSKYQDRIYDRQLNIALGFVLDMLLYSFKRKKWNIPDPLTVVHHEFIYTST